MKNIVSGFTILLFIAVMIIDSSNINYAVANAVEVCLNLIIPSLFGFMFISTFIVRTKLDTIIFKPLFLLLRPIIRIPEDMFSVFMLSLFGGYPVGAKLIYDGYSDRKFTKATSENMLIYSYSGSPTFIISLIGIGIYKSPIIGIIAYISNILSSITIALVLNIKNEVPKIKKDDEKPVVSTSIFIDSVIAAGKTLFTVSVMIVFFGLLLGMIRFLISSLNVSESMNYLLFESFFEISNISRIKTANINLLPLFSSLSSFGGLCIILQVIAITGGHLNLKKFFIGRIFAAFLSYIYCFIIITLFNINIAVSASSSFSGYFSSRAGTPIASIGLLIMIFILINSEKETVSLN